MRRAKRELNLPRAPLPKQVGGPHKDKRRAVGRAAKHKGALRAQED